jgi:hypothetical protein
VERQVPGGVPGVLPLVGHRDDVVVVEVLPLAVASGPAADRRRRPGGIAVEPAANVVVEELLAPQQPREGLPHDSPRVVGQMGGDDGGVELVGLALAAREHPVELAAQHHGGRRRIAQAQPDGRAGPGGEGEPVARGGLGADAIGVDRVLAAVHDVVVDTVLHEGAGVGRAPQPGLVRVVVSEQQLGLALAAQPPATQFGVRHLDRRLTDDGPQARPRRRGVPGPCVAEPQRGQQVQLGRLGPAIGDGHPHQDVLGGGLRVFHGHVEVPVLGKDAGVEQLVLGRPAVAPPVLLHERRVGEGRLRVLVERAHVGVGRRRVDIEVVFLHVLA